MFHWVYIENRIRNLGKHEIKAHIVAISFIWVIFSSDKRSTKTLTVCVENKYLVEWDMTECFGSQLRSQSWTFIRMQTNCHSIWMRLLEILLRAHQICAVGWALNLNGTPMSHPDFFMNSNATWPTSFSLGWR